MEPIKIKTSSTTLDNWSQKEYGSWEQSVPVEVGGKTVTYEKLSGMAHYYNWKAGEYRVLDVARYVSRRECEHVREILLRYRTRVEVRTEIEALEVLASGEYNGWWWDYPMRGVQRVTERLAHALEDQGYTVHWPGLNQGRFTLVRPDGTLVRSRW